MILALLCVIVCGVLLGVPDFHVWAQKKQLQYTTQVQKGESVLALMKAETAVVTEGKEEHTMKGQLRLEPCESIFRIYGSHIFMIVR